MADLFLPLDVEYASDDEFIEAGPMAELLFIRAGCFIKRKKLDGKLKKSQLTLASTNIPNPKKHAEALVRVGLWVDEGDHWMVPSYLKRNRSKAEIETARQLSVESGQKGAHVRFHVPPEGTPNAKCPLCVRERMASPIGDPKGRANGVGWPLTEPETLTEPEPLTEPSSYLHPLTTPTVDTRPADVEDDRNGPRRPDFRAILGGAS